MTTTYTLEVPGWRPTLDNELKGHPLQAHRRKRKDADMIAVAALAYGVPAARGKRRVGLSIRGRFGRFPDPLAPWKSLLDALVTAGLLVDDAAAWCEVTPVVYSRGERRTIITLEDVG